ncbi:MAG: hypothetical protein ABIR05_06105 [Luteimonas sp.]
MTAASAPHSNEPWQLQPASARARLWLFLPCVALPMVVSLALAVPLVMKGAPMLSAPFRAWGIQTLGVLAFTVVLWVLLDRLIHRHRLQVDAGGIEVTTTFYRRRLAWPELQLDSAKVIAIQEHTEHAPMLRTNGVSIIGFNSGWFRSRTMEKLFVATAGGERLAWLPTTLGYSLLLQPRKPQALLDRLRELAPSPPRR